MTWSKAVEKRIVRVVVCRGRVTTIMRGTVINGAKPGVGSQNLGAFGTNGSQSLSLGRCIYTFGLLNTSGIDVLLGTIWYSGLQERREVLRLWDLRRKMGNGWDIVVGDFYPRELGMRRAIPGRVVRGRWYTWGRGGLWGAETGREGFGIVGTPIPGSGLPRVHLKPRREGVLSRDGTRGRTVLVRERSQDVLEGELIPRGELGDNLIVNPRSGTL
jgi:hypothetical protein